AFAVVLVAATAISAWQAIRAHRALKAEAEQRQAAQDQRDRALKAEGQAQVNLARAQAEEANAKRSASEAQAVLEFFRDKVISAARPEGQEGGLGTDVTLRVALDAAEKSIATGFIDQPVIEADIRTTLGESYLYLGEPARAIGQLERAWA